jgi:hypothetical protein
MSKKQNQSQGKDKGKGKDNDRDQKGHDGRDGDGRDDDRDGDDDGDHHSDGNGCVAVVPPHAGNVLFVDDFNSYGTPAQYAAVSLAPKWVTAPTSGVTEIVKQGYGNTAFGDGGYWLDTQGTPGGIDIKTTITDPNAGAAKISVSLAVPFDGMYVSTPLQVIWNGVAHTINIADFAGANNFQTFEWQVTSNVTNTLQIKDLGVGTVGLALDSVTVTDWIL